MVLEVCFCLSFGGRTPLRRGRGLVRWGGEVRLAGVLLSRQPWAGAAAGLWDMVLVR